MRIVSWNVNGIRALEKKGFVAWLEREAPDMLCIQETKARPEQLSPEALRPEGYVSYWAGARKAGYAGVAIYSRTEPLDVKTLGVAEFDDEGRVLQADYQDFSLISAYFPNSQPGSVRIGYKLAFCEAILEHCTALSAQGRHVILCGDYNIAHTPLDLARPDENEGSPGFLPQERGWMDRFMSSGFVDTFRSFHAGEGGQYSWWSYRAQARRRNVGWRLDYHCVDQMLMSRVRNAAIWREVTGSDHCPVVLDL
jgi:exodeoxyribonuclease-3